MASKKCFEHNHTLKFEGNRKATVADRYKAWSRATSFVLGGREREQSQITHLTRTDGEITQPVRFFTSREHGSIRLRSKTLRNAVRLINSSLFNDGVSPVEVI